MDKKQAKKNFDYYLQDGLLKKEIINTKILSKLENNALESLISAKNLFDNNISLLWTVVISYYAMFYIASAYIYTKGYKVQHKIVHKVVHDTLIVLSKNELEKKFLEDYTEEKDKALSIAEAFLDTFEYERAKRSSFQYEMTSELKESRAKTSLKRAQVFVDLFRNIIHKNNN